MSIQTQEEFTVDDLPRFSPWPARLLGLTNWEPRKKTPAEVTREFGREKWGALLERQLVAGEAGTLDVVEQWALEHLPPSLCSIGERFELLTPQQAHARHFGVVAETLHRMLPANALFELGAGYGNVILKLAADQRFQGIPLYAAEYTDSGVELMKRLAGLAGVGLRVGHCDLGAQAITNLSIPEGSIVFTCMAAHYIPELNDQFVEAFRRMRPKTVVHFEPCYEHCNVQTLTGALRRRYIEMNDYNRNLVQLLHQQAASGAIRVDGEIPAVIGVNPLLPISILTWTFRQPGR